MSNQPEHQDTLRTAAETELARAPKPEVKPRPAEELLHELEVHQIELEMQNEQLRQSQVELEKSRDRYVDFYDFAPVGYLTLNHEGMIDEINLTGAALFGVERGRLLCRRFAPFVAPEDQDVWYRHFLSVLTHDTKQSCELALQHGDGSRFFAQLDCLRLKKDGNDPVVRIALTDITQRKEAEKEFQKFFNLIPDLACVASTDGRFLKINPMWQEALGYTEQEILDTPIIDFIHPDDRDETMKHVERQLAGEPTVQFTNRYRCKDGSYKWLEWRATPAINKKLLFASARDITERKQAEQALHEADRHKNEFLAMLAHELRNPLAPIRNAAHVIGRLGLAEPRVEWAREVIERQVNHLARLVDDLLDVSRIARGKIMLRKEAIEFAALAGQVIESVRPLAENKGHRLAVRLPDQAVQLQGDPVRIPQLLFNLLDNAIKYTPDGGQIEFAARLDGQEIEISVRDNGMGIREELLPRVFDLFQQDERKLDRAQGGLGIGLTLVQRLAEMHGGRVEAYSAGPGLGSTFTVRLPARAMPALSPRPEPESRSHPAAGMRVLVVEDDHAVADSTAVLLEMEGHQARIAESGQAALEQIPEFRPQVVLLDIGLKGMDGFETAQRLRQLPEGRGLYLVAVTGYGDSATRKQALASGCDHFLVKPVAYNVLSGLLCKVTAQVMK